MLEPAGGRVLIKPDSVEKVSEGGIIMAVDERVEKQGIRVGIVKSVGKTAWSWTTTGEPWAKVGDKVYYARHSGTFITDPTDEAKEEYILVNDEDITMIITET